MQRNLSKKDAISLLAVAWAGSLVLTSSASGQSFQPIADVIPPAGDAGFYLSAGGKVKVSQDGSTVIYSPEIGSYATWRSGEGSTPVEQMSVVLDLNASGDTVYGLATNPPVFGAASFSIDGTLTGLEPADTTFSLLTAATPDASFTVGEADFADGRLGYRRSADGSVVRFEVPGSSPEALFRPVDISADGRVVIGQGANGAPMSLRWTEDTGVTAIDTGPNGLLPTALSATGDVIAGIAFTDAGPNAAIFTDATGVKILPSADFEEARANTIDATGTLVGGLVRSELVSDVPNAEAAMWLNEQLFLLEDLLPQDLLPDGVVLHDVRSLTVIDDDVILVGLSGDTASDTFGLYRVSLPIATIPEPTALTTLAGGLLLLRRRR